MSVFDPNTFMGEVTTEVGETEYKPIPEGDYLASIGSDEKDVKPRPVKDGGVAFDIFWYIEDAQLAAALNMGDRKPRAKQGFFIQLDSNGKLAWGTNENVPLMRVRHALGQDKKGQSWSPRKLFGSGPALVTIKHRHDDKDPSIIYAEVVAVAPASARKAA